MQRIVVSKNTNISVNLRDSTLKQCQNMSPDWRIACSTKRFYNWGFMFDVERSFPLTTISSYPYWD